MLLVDTSTYYKSRRAGQAGLEQRIKEICQTRVRYGYRRVHVLLRREGWPINQKKTRRVYRELGLQLRNIGTLLIVGKLRRLGDRPIGGVEAFQTARSQFNATQVATCSRRCRNIDPYAYRWLNSLRPAAVSAVKMGSVTSLDIPPPIVRTVCSKDVQKV